MSVTLALLLLLSAANAAAQATRIAYVASEAVISRLPEAQNARSKLAETQASWLREIERQEGEIASVERDISTNRLLWSQQEKQEAGARLADLVSKLAAYRSSKFGPNGEFEKLQRDVMGPIIDKVTKAIEEEARAGKYDYVIDKSNRGAGIVYANPVNDLTVGVLRRLGVDVSQEFNGRAQEPSGMQQGSAHDAIRNRGTRDRARESQNEADPNQVLAPEQQAPPPVPVPDGAPKDPQ